MAGTSLTAPHGDHPPAVIQDSIGAVEGKGDELDTDLTAVVGYAGAAAHRRVGHIAADGDIAQQQGALGLVVSPDAEAAEGRYNGQVLR